MAKILGMGNALVDIMTRLDHDKVLEMFKLPKGSMQLVDREFSDQVLEGTKGFTHTLSSGGSAANTIHGLARLGIETAFLGKVGHDHLGDFFRKDMVECGIRPILLESDTDSGRAIALVSPDSERTFATYLGAAVELSANDLTPEIFKGYDVFHIEGYLVQNHELMLKSLKLAKEAGLMISLDMASYNVVESNLEFLRKVIMEYVNIVFANEEEAKAFTGLEPHESLIHFSEMVDIAVVKIGSLGSLVKNGDGHHHVKAHVTVPVDTTGAGDAYAAGFLYGVVNGYSMDRCGAVGTLLARHVIEVLGAKVDEASWDEIREQVKMI